MSEFNSAVNHALTFATAWTLAILAFAVAERFKIDRRERKKR